MSEKLVELQKALDNRPKYTYGCPTCKSWFEDFTKKFAAYRAELELPVDEWLIQNAKRQYKIYEEMYDKFNETFDGNFADWKQRQAKIDEIADKKWVSVDEIQPRLAQILHDKIVAEEKNVEYAKLVAGQAQEYAEKIEKLQTELNEANLLCELQASRISGLETFKKQCNSKVLVDRKELTERVLEIDKPANHYGEVCEQNRQYRILLKELLWEAAK